MMKPLETENLLHGRWQTCLARDGDGAPLQDPLFVLEQGSALHLVDIRPVAAAEGVVGHIPGSEFVQPDDLATHSFADAPIVLISREGRTAARAALALEQSGKPLVAAMAGGLAAWRSLGLATSRTPPEPLLPTSDVDADGDGVLSRSEVAAHIGDPRTVRWVKLASVLGHSHCSCVDGRDERGVIGMPGGDAGEFLLSMAALEKVTGETLDEAAMRRALLARTDTFGRFYIHTDVGALQRLLDAARAHDRLSVAASAVESLDDLEALLRHPQREDEEALLEELTVPEHVGCGHIRLMMQHSEQYGVRPGLAETFWRAAYRLWWAGAPEIYLTALGGGHREAAVLNVRLEEEIWEFSHIPLISPLWSGRQVFVNHPDVSAFLRAAAVEFNARGLGPVALDGPHVEAYRQTIYELADRQLGATIGHLAKGLPIFDVVFDRDGSFDVREPSA